MKFQVVLIGLVLFSLTELSGQSGNFYEADHAGIQYTGRVDFTNAKKPRFWAAGVYIRAGFEGTFVEISIDDQVIWGKDHNYIEIIIDNQTPFKVKLGQRENTITAATGLAPGNHTITICKNTESLMGYLEFVGMRCEGMLPAAPRFARKIEFIGNSITSGASMDLAPIPCDGGAWYDQHNAWYSYGAITARTLSAQWHLTSDSGIGLIHSCCDKKYTMPQVFNKMNIGYDSVPWNFNNYQPDVVTICLGQNDGIQDSLKFCRAYVEFLGRLRLYYPKAQLICLTSPMANEPLTRMLKNYLTGIVSYITREGDKNIDKYFFNRSYNNGCGGHPDMRDHELIAQELTGFIRKKMRWKL